MTDPLLVGLGNETDVETEGDFHSWHSFFCRAHYRDIHDDEIGCD